MKSTNLTVLICLLSITLFAQKPGKWRNLFDGKTTQGWHSNHQKSVKGWEVINRSLMSHGRSGDLVTDEEFGDFQLEFEFKIPPEGNSGVIYKVIETEKKVSYYSGPEYQIIDDKNYPPDTINNKLVYLRDNQKTAANYDMHAPSQLVSKPAGEWNKGRILVKNNHVEHWLNGVKVVEYEYGSDAWKAQIAKSKFAEWPYAEAHHKGKIALQDHREEVWYRKIRIRLL